MKTIKFYLIGLSLAISQVLSATDVNVKDYGAKGDGSSDDNSAINNAISACNSSGGGTVLFPSGTYMAKAIHLKSNVALKLDGATIKANSGQDSPESNSANDDYQDFGHSHFRNALIWGENLTNIKIIGKGAIDGNGKLSKSDSPGNGTGDKAISLKLCKNVEIGGLDANNRLTMSQYGHFGILATGVDQFSIHDIYVPNKANQRDFLDLMSCNDGTVTNITVDLTNDDVIKLGADYSLGFKRPSSNIAVKTITGKTTCNICTIGSETVANFTNISFTDITTKGNGKAVIALMSNDGGILDGITVDNVRGSGAASPIYIKVTNRGRCPNPTLGKIKNVTISNMTVTGNNSDYTSTIAGFKSGSTLSTIENITLRNVNLTSPGGNSSSDASINPPELTGGDYNLRYMGTRPGYGLFLRYTDGVTLENVKFTFNSSDGRPAVVGASSANTIFNTVTAQKGSNSNDVIFRDASCTYCLTNSTLTVSGGTKLTNCGGPVPTVPVAPSNLTATVVSCSQVNLAWTDNATNETSYTVENITKGTSVSLPADSKSYSATGLSESTAYSFRVTAVNSVGSSTGNPTASATTIVCPVPTVPIPPSGFTATVVSCSQINLAWTDNANNETGYVVTNSTTGVSANLPADSKSYSATGLAVSTSYNFTVSAVNSIGSSVNNPTVSATTLASCTPVSDKIWIEAENGTISSPMAISSDANASNGKYIMAPSGTNSSSSAPSSGYSTMSLTAAGGSYALWFRTLLPTTSTNSFYYRIDAGSWVSWNVDANVSTAWTWRSVATITLGAGSHTLTVAYREGGSQLDRILLTTDAAYVPTGMGEGDVIPPSTFDNLALEAESGTITSPMTVQSDATASGGQYIMAPTGTNSSTSAPSSGYSTISFTAAGGSYKMWFKTILPTTSANSFYYRIDGGSWVTWSDNTYVSTVWQWNPAGSLTLTAGAHTLTIAYREGGSQLDRIAISNDPAYDPAVTLKSEESSALETGTTLKVYPTIADQTVNIELSLSKEADIQLFINSEDGKLLESLSEQNIPTGLFNKTLDVSKLSNGIYFITVIANDKKQTSKILVGK